MLAWEQYGLGYIAYCELGHFAISFMAVALVLSAWTGIIFLFPMLGNFTVPKWCVSGLQLSFLGFVASYSHYMTDVLGIGV